jgi:hypothetical protein
MATLTKEEARAGLATVMAVADAIRELGRVPAGHLYAHLMGHGITKAGFDSIIGLLTREADGVTPLVRREGHELVWNEGGEK